MFARECNFQIDIPQPEFPHENIKGMANPRPLPTALKIANGNPGKRKLNEAEPNYDATTAPCPPWLTQRGKLVWKELAPLLSKRGVLTDADLNAFGRYCNCCADWRDTYDQKKEKGTDLIVRDEEGKVTGVVPLPYVKRLREHEVMLLKYEQEFGLTPSSRSRIVANPDAADDLEDALEAK